MIVRSSAICPMEEGLRLADRSPAALSGGEPRCPRPMGEAISRVGPGRDNVKIREWVIRPLPAYASILLLQLKVVWGMGWARDLTTGDTSAYFVAAQRWSVNGFYNLVWSARAAAVRDEEPAH